MYFFQEITERSQTIKRFDRHLRTTSCKRRRKNQNVRKRKREIDKQYGCQFIFASSHRGIEIR